MSDLRYRAPDSPGYLALAQAIGKKATVTVLGGDIRIDVVIVDVKQSYGQTRYLVKPLAGLGSAWVQNLNIIEEGT